MKKLIAALGLAALMSALAASHAEEVVRFARSRKS
jgi:hypothetical protein